MISKFIQTEVKVIYQSKAESDNFDRGFDKPCLDIMAKPNSIIDLLYNYNINS